MSKTIVVGSPTQEQLKAMLKGTTDEAQDAIQRAFANVEGMTGAGQVGAQFGTIFCTAAICRELAALRASFEKAVSGQKPPSGLAAIARTVK